MAVSGIEKARNDFNNLLGVQYYEVHEDLDVGLKVSLPKNPGLELVAPIGEESWVGQFIKAHGDGLMIAVYIAVYKVPDIKKAEEHLTKRGLKPIAKFERGKSKEVIFSPEGAHGMCIVINEYPDVSAVGIEAAKYFAELKKQQ